MLWTTLKWGTTKPKFATSLYSNTQEVKLNIKTTWWTLTRIYHIKQKENGIHDNEIVCDIQRILYVMWNAVEEMDSNSAVMVWNIHIWLRKNWKKWGASWNSQLGCRPEKSHLNMWLKCRKPTVSRGWRAARCPSMQPCLNFLKCFI